LGLRSLEDLTVIPANPAEKTSKVDA
jgi:hypothetical protein